MIRNEISGWLKGILRTKQDEFQGGPEASGPSMFSGLDDTVDVHSLYSFGSQLGQGGFGTVCVATHKASKAKFACKTISKAKLEDAQALLSFRIEAEIHLHLAGHKNIVNIIDCFEDAKNIYLIEELCTGGTLLDKLIKNGRFTEQEAAEYIQTILTLVDYCHRLGICHRDIKLENFLISEPGPNGILKATDFGLSCFLSKGDTRRDIVGTVHYTAPEVFTGPYSLQADVWSCGVVLYALLSELLPFCHNDMNVLVKYILQAPIELEEGPWLTVSNGAKDLVRKMLTRDPNKRITIEAALKHPWIREQGKTPENDRPFLRRIKEFGELPMFKRRLYVALVKEVPADYTKGLQTMFSAMDKNTDGKLTVEEATKFIMSRKYPGTPADVEFAVKTLDLDGVGYASLNAFLAGVINRSIFHNTNMANAAFRLLDASGKGTINKEQMATFLKRRVDADDVAIAMDVLDQNKDGVVDREEFISHWMQRSKSLSGADSADLNQLDPSSTGDLTEVLKGLPGKILKVPTRVLNYLEPTSLFSKLGLSSSG